MEINLLLSSHRALITNYKERIAELLNHHQKRLDETYEILNHESPMTVLEVTKKCTGISLLKAGMLFPKAKNGLLQAKLMHISSTSWP